MASPLCPFIPLPAPPPKAAAPRTLQVLPAPGAQRPPAGFEPAAPPLTGPTLPEPAAAALYRRGAVRWGGSAPGWWDGAGLLLPPDTAACGSGRCRVCLLKRYSEQPQAFPHQNIAVAKSWDRGIPRIRGAPGGHGALPRSAQTHTRCLRAVLVRSCHEGL